MITIETPGGQTLIQDRGRHGFRQLGVGWSGAFDQQAATLANTLVANEADAAVLEVLLGGLRFSTLAPVRLAVTGAATEVVVTTDNTSFHIPPSHAVAVPIGAMVSLGVPTIGMRTYIAFAGGLDVEPVLGSRSFDTLGLLGPPPLATGHTLSLLPESSNPRANSSATSRAGQQGSETTEFGTTDLASSDLLAALAASGPPFTHSNSEVTSLEVSPSSHSELVDGDLADLFASRTWTVGNKSSRIGIRLSGDPLPLDYPSTWDSEPTLPGSIQVAPSGELIVFGPDAPTTGGYPVIAVAPTTAVSRLSQLRPGSQLRLRITE